MGFLLLSEIDDDFEVGEVPLDEVLLDLLHGDTLGLHGFRDRNNFLDLIQAWAGAASQLLRAKRRDVDVEKTAFDRRRLRVNDRRIFSCRRVDGRRLQLREFKFRHSLQAYPGPKEYSNPESASGTRRRKYSSLSLRMLALIALAGLLFAGLAVTCVLGVAFFVVKVVFWAIFLPFRLLFKLMWLPVGLVMGALSLAAGATLLPILLVVGLVVAVLGAIAALIALLVPAIPFFLLGLTIWALTRKRPVAA